METWRLLSHKYYQGSVMYSTSLMLDMPHIIRHQNSTSKILYFLASRILWRWGCTPILTCKILTKNMRKRCENFDLPCQDVVWVTWPGVYLWKTVSMRSTETVPLPWQVTLFWIATITAAQKYQNGLSDSTEIAEWHCPSSGAQGTCHTCQTLDTPVGSATGRSSQPLTVCIFFFYTADTQ